MCLLCLSQPMTADTCKVYDHDLNAVSAMNPGALAAVVTETTDAPGNTTTTYTMAVGDTFDGTLDTPSGDQDMVAIDLAAGEFVTISMTGGTLADPLMGLFGADGTLLAVNDDISSSNYNSQLNYHVQEAGTYYILASSFNQAGAGTYTLAATAETVPDFDLLASIDLGIQVPGTSAAGGTIDVYFATSGETFDSITSEGFNAYELQQFQAAFDIFESYLNVEFNVVNSAIGADFALVLDTNELSSGLLGYFYVPYGGRQIGVFNGAAWDRTAGGDLEVGGFGFLTILHELGHGLGLNHPFDDSTAIPFSTSGQDAAALGAYGLNQGVYTMMTYADGFLEGPVGTAASGSNYGYALGPLALDLAVLQADYGADTLTGAGDTLYTLPTANQQGTGWQAIWDAGGDNDTIANPGSEDSVIDLRPATLDDDFGGGGFLSAVDGIQGGFSIVNGVEIEHASGGSGHDLLRGNTDANGLQGNDGRDTLLGGGGDDTLEGGGLSDVLRGDAGNDTMFGASGWDRLYAGANDDRADGGGGNDLVLGEDGRDTLFGGTGDDTLEGGAGSDRMRGNDGDDTLFGASGWDQIFGGNNNDRADGGAGNDTLYGDAGSDTLFGGLGDDLLDGGAQSDRLRGMAGSDTLIGGSGWDQLFGGTEADRLEGGTGNDTLQGDAGADVFVFENGYGNDLITDFETAGTNDQIDLSAVTAITDYTDLTTFHLSDSGSDVLIDDLAGNVITIQNTAVADLSAAHFILV